MVARVAQDLTDNEADLNKLQVELVNSQIRRGTTQDRLEREALEEHIRHLQEELRVKRQESERLRMQLQQNQGTFLRTEEHRSVLERALALAREEVIIISPWMNRRACDAPLCDLVAQAVKRGVHIRIGYGITERPGDLDDGRNRANAQKVIRSLRTAVVRYGLPENTELLDIQKTRGTHQKILVCDRTFAVLGSFNWLSYRGEKDEEYRNETSILLRDSTSVTELARIALSEWSQ
jgi:phosphatidylserine/phosphatidylglycerophosphate/cardiolipin synthase-like enzyme